MEQKPKKLRLSVRFVDGVMESQFGGTIDLVDDAKAELVVNESDLADKALLASLRAKQTINILSEGTTLVAILSNRHPEKVSEALDEAATHEVFSESDLGTWFEWNAHLCTKRRYVEMVLGPKDPNQGSLREFASGGLWLQIKGGRGVGILSSQVLLPDAVSKEPALSLNHAYTLLSEAYEPWRTSHTGNIYEQVLYQETNGKWYPLEFLREKRELENGQDIAKGVWDRFMQRMSGRARNT